jgi:hypothetical protein
VSLTDLLHEHADAMAFDPPDVAALERAGTRAVRRRRARAVLATAAAAVLAGAVAVVAVGGHHDPAPVDGLPAGLTWVSGSTLHTADGDVDLGRGVVGYVRTADGIVFDDAERRVWSWTGGAPVQVGQAGARFQVGWPSLAGDTDGTRAAWVDQDRVMVLDQASGATQSFPVSGPESVLTVDGTRLDLFAGERSRTLDLATGQSTTGPALAAEEDGSTITYASDGTLVGHPAGGDAVAWPGLTGEPVLSPDGHLAAVGSGQSTRPATILDLRRSSHHDLPLAGVRAYPYEWLDDDTVVVLTLAHEDDHFQLQTCSASALTCRVVVADLGQGVHPPGEPRANGTQTFVLPIGEPYYAFPHG